MSALLTELTAGPLADQIAPHLSAGEIGIIYGLLHKPNIPVTGDVSWSNFTMWLASGPMLAVSANAANNSSPLQAGAQVLLSVIQSGNSLELSNPNVRTLFDDWVMIPGGITQAEHDLLIAMAQKLISRADQIPTINTSMEALGVAMFGGDVWL